MSEENKPWEGETPPEKQDDSDQSDKKEESNEQDNSDEKEEKKPSKASPESKQASLALITQMQRGKTRKQALAILKKTKQNPYV